MKKYILDFLRRGVISCGIGPMVLVVIYLILERQGSLEALSVNQVCVGILSVTALAFIAGGANALYQIERLPLMMAILIHGAVLYVAYLITYLVNDWLEWGAIPVIVFTGIFVIGYFIIWLIIYSVIKRNTEKLNKILKEKQQRREDGLKP